MKKKFELVKCQAFCDDPNLYISSLSLCSTVCFIFVCSQYHQLTHTYFLSLPTGQKAHESRVIVLFSASWSVLKMELDPIKHLLNQ
jgi:hypothetical protein